MIVKEKRLYSNCLIQALKHKLLDWKNVKIKAFWYKSKHWYHLHFYWQTDEHDYDFAPCWKWFGQPVFKGCIRKHSKGTFAKLKSMMIKSKANKG